MKKIKHVFMMLTVLTVVAFGSCKKSNPTPTPKTVSDQSISLDVNGTPYSSTNLASTYSKSQNLIQVAGQLNSTTAVYFVLTGGVNVGVYNFSDGHLQMGYTDGTSQSNSFAGSSGVVNVTSFTATSISGTFTFTVVNPANVTLPLTEGKFTADYTTQ